MKTKVPILEQCVLSVDGRNNITVEGLKSYLQRNNQLVFPHRHNFYQFVLFTQGGGSHSVDFEVFHVQKNQIYFMAPGQIHTWEFDDDVDGYVVNFNPDTFQTLLLRTDYLSHFVFFAGTPQQEVFLLSEHVAQLITSVLEKAILRFTQQDLVRVSLLYVMHLVESQLEPTVPRGDVSFHFTVLSNFSMLIEKNYRELRLPKNYAALLFITPNHLNALSKEYLGIPAGEVIRNRVLLEAKRMLAIRDYSISEIAYELNFTDNSYFTKFFKKAAGVTPEEFRRQYIL